MKPDVSWRVERQVRGKWVFAAWLRMPKGSRAVEAIARFRQLYPLPVTDPLRAHKGGRP